MRISRHLSLMILHELNEITADGTAPLYFRLTGGGRKEISPGVKVKPEYWDKDSWRVKSKCPDAHKRNRLMDYSINTINETKKKKLHSGIQRMT